MKKPSLTIVLSLCALLMLGACEKKPIHRHFQSLPQFGTSIDINLNDVEPERAKRAMARMDQHFSQWHTLWSAQSGDLHTFNQALSKNAQAFVPESMRDAFKQAQVLSGRSHGFFAPELDPLVRLWGFDDASNLPSTPPKKATIDAWLASHQALHTWTFTQDQLIAPNQTIEHGVDLGGFIKGAAIDEALNILKSMHIKRAMINAGGDIGVLGKHSLRKWRVAIAHPRSEKANTPHIATLELDSGERVFTSGDYERYFEANGTRYHHILNPKTGYPGKGLMAATVVHTEGALADALATALMAAGADDWRDMLKAFPDVPLWMVMDDASTIWVSPNLEPRLIMQDPMIKVTIVDAL